MENFEPSREKYAFRLKVKMEENLVSKKGKKDINIPDRLGMRENLEATYGTLYIFTEIIS